ncbi:MAG: hypothetical protein IJ521_12995 [Schwartzia sp.]|nr:hypothetical protein [Schwartzia sp. (in: firmicutes)]MBQ8699889.1 hypothetical protein [Schwartzia sp. (in: firmicutes)]
MVETPKFIYRDREVTPAPVKMKVWRELLKDSEEEKNLDMAARMDAYLRGIVKVFGRDEITVEVLEDCLAVEDVIPLYSQCVQYVFGLAFAKLDKLPNADAPEA